MAVNAPKADIEGARAVFLVIPDLDIWRAANLLIQRHAADAELEACRLADLMLERGDRDGLRLWLRVRQAIVERQAEPRGPAH